ncbi:MAG: hypothetical protein NTU41_06265 [Chloroflexi bacterium]|nr:hypothetical protein [Chloroflexota bacterium]
MHTTAPAEFSNSLNSPERWYARWATRFYKPAVSEGEDTAIERLLFVSIHFASDYDTKVDEPVVSAGRLLYGEPMNKKTANDSYDYWMCKYWFHGQSHPTLDGWRQTRQSGWCKNLKGSETFVVPLYDITSSDKLKEQVIDHLLECRPQASLGEAYG